MNFLHPAALWGLLALAVPIILHFFNLQRPKNVLFSHVSFVKEIQQTVVRRIRFRQWILLALRLLAIAGLCLAFAGPILVDKQKSENGSQRSVVLIIDNSYSMTASNDRSDYFHQAQDIARELVKAYGRQDEILVMPSSDLKLNFPFSRQEEGLEAITNMKINQSLASLRDIYQVDGALFSRASFPLHELYLLSDFQTSTMLADSSRVPLADAGITARLIPIANRAQRNVYVSQNKIQSRIIEKGKPARMTMRIVNDGTQPVNDLSVQVVVDDKVVAISNADLPAQGFKDLTVSFTPETAGWLGGYVSLDDNPIDFDNRRYFSLYVPMDEKVLVVEGEPMPAVKVLYESIFTQLDQTLIGEKNLGTVNLSDYQSIVYYGVNQVSSGMADKLGQFVADGGGLLLIPGTKPNLASLNGLLSVLGVGSYGPAVTVAKNQSVAANDLSHPLFEGMFQSNQTNRNFDPPVVYKYYPFTAAPNKVHETILTLDDRKAILEETKSGNGLVYTFAMPLLEAWTDFPVKTLFAPLLFRTTQMLNQTQIVQNSQEIGSFTPVAIRTSSQEIIQLEDETGATFIPEQYARNGAVYLQFDRLLLHEGIYQVKQGEALLQKIAFNISDAESQLACASEPEISAWLAGRGLTQSEIITGPPDVLARQIQSEREGAPLWKYFLIFAVVFLVAETLLLHQKESGSAEKTSKAR